MSLGKLVLDLSLNGNQFTVSLKQAEGMLGQFALGANRADSSVRRAETSTRSWGKSLRDTIISLALVRDALRTLQQATLGWQAAILSTNSEMEKSIMLMKNFSKQKDPMVATQEAVADVNKLLTRASTSPFNLSQVTDAFVKLRVGGVEPVWKSLDTLIDSVAAFGGSGENLKRAGVAIQQMAGKGVVSMEELRQQLGESVPTAINAMADALGTSYSKLVKEISQGKVTSKPAVLAMMQELERSFAGSAASMMNTWGGAVAQFETGLKRLAVAFGGLNENGYDQNGYLKTITNELKGLNDVLTSPEMLQSAKELGQSIASMISVLADGTKWVLEHRDAILEWSKAILILWASFKGVSLIQSTLAATGTALSALSMKFIQMRMSGQGVISTMTGMAATFSGWNSSAAVAAGGATRIATGSSAAGTAVRLLGGALGVIAGPIGLVAGLAISGGLAWMEYKKGVNEAEKAILGLQGALTSMAQLKTLTGVRDKLQEDFNEDFVTNNKAMILQKWGTLAAYKEAREQRSAEIAKINADILKGENNIAETQANAAAQSEIQANAAALGEISRKYVIDKENIRKKFEDEAKKNGKKVDEDALAEAFVEEQKNRVNQEIALYEGALTKVQEIESNLKGNGRNRLSVEDETKLKAASKAAQEYELRISDAKDALLQLGKVKLKDTLIDPGDGGPGGKPVFDGMTIFVDGLRKKLATLDAKLEETNPYMAQLNATVESLGGKKLPSFDKVFADGQKMAAQLWEQEKARKAITDASKIQADALERIDQIQTLAKAKLNKTEERNPWEKASADAIRYEEELTDLIVKMDEARRKAEEAQKEGSGQSLLEKLAQDAVKAAAEVETTRQALERLKVSDSGKRMQEDSLSINDNLLTETDRAKVQYDREVGYLDSYFAKHSEYLLQDQAALDSYYAYRESLEANYARQTESGLDEWIRLNRDATAQYKTLWGSAMDKMNETLVQGLITGKAEFGDFVMYVLEEFLKIQMAKQLAMAGEAIAGSGLMSAISTGIGSFFGGTGANGMAAGSAGATSSSLGASQAGYSSQYIKFANGGIMTEYGQLALNKYANGGIAREPQVAIYGEGKMAEAYVPLPDGRTIPVTLSGTGGGESSKGMSGSVPVEVNLYNQGGQQQEAQSNAQFDGEKLIVDVVLRNMNQPGPMRDAIRGAK